MSASGSAKSRMERILRLQEQIDEIKSDIREIYAEEKADGGDKTAMGAAISYIRKRAKDKNAFDEREALASVYINAFEATGTVVATHTHAPDAKLVETIVKGVQTETGRKALVTALDVMIDAETGEITEHEQPETADKIGDRDQTHNSHHVGRALGADRQGAMAAQVPDTQSDGGAIVAVKAQSRLANADSVEPSPSDTNPQPSTLSGADKPEAVRPPAVSGAISDSDVPAFIKRDYVLHPHCLNPSLCAGSGREHCHRCKRAMAESEAA